MDDRRHLRSFGRIKARTLKPRQAGLMEALLPHLALPEAGAIDVEAVFGAPPLPGGEGAGGDGRQDGPSWSEPNAPPPQGRRGTAPLVLEIGFGGGEHLVAQAAARSDARFIGVEPFQNGVASCLRHIEESGVTNVRLHMGDARDVIARLPDECLDLVYILFPDPWPKARHHKRRLIQPAFLGELARVLKAGGPGKGGEVRFATDWANYAEWTLWRFVRDARFRWLAERADDWRKPWDGHVTTRYEAKRLGDCKPVWLRFGRA
jgi:tRNA (guanine-N7-)-methyltransferase